MLSVDDKKGAALSNQRFQMLEDIAQELAGEVVFPTYFGVMLQLRKVLADQQAPATLICDVISCEPMVCSKILGLANSAAFKSAGGAVTDVRTAVDRLGLNVVRGTAMAVVMKQLLLCKGLSDFDAAMKQLWEHSVMSASAAYVIADRITDLDPDDAFLAGLVHDVGVYYMLYRSSQYEELRERPDTIRYLMVQWHESIGESLVNALGLPEKIGMAIRDHDQPRELPVQPASLGDVVYVANILAGGVLEWMFKDLDSAVRKRGELSERYLELLPAIREHLDKVRTAFEL